MPNVLVVGATRGLGLELAKQYTSRPSITVYGTARSSTPCDGPDSIKWIKNIDLTQESSTAALASSLPEPVDTVLISAGVFMKESFDQPSWKDEVAMYTTSSIAPVFIVHHLVQTGKLRLGAKVILISSEAGSIGLRHESEGGGNYAHHASKAALNMVGKLLSLDLKEKGVAVGMVHPGFMRTEMTAGVGFDQFWDSGGAVKPEVAAKSVVDFVEGFGIEKTGSFWAPRGPADIGTADKTMGPKDKLPTPLELPW
ncbi:Short chain dehydrogenase-like protein 36 [Elsinoe fawcettii]|nr:Short chain dehydrogenase-like protein 36 [Elsinoe fawcettii]